MEGSSSLPIIFPDLNAALPEPNAGNDVQNNDLSFAFSGILSAANDIAKEYENLQITRNIAEETAKNLEKAGLSNEANQVRSLGSTATLNPFNPEQNQQLQQQFTQLFANSSESLRQRNTQLQVQAARNEAALIQLRESGNQSRLTQEQGFLQDLQENVQKFGQQSALQSQSGEQRLGLQDDLQAFQSGEANKRFAEDLIITEVRERGANQRALGRSSSSSGGLTTTDLENVASIAAGTGRGDEDDAIGTIGAYINQNGLDPNTPVVQAYQSIISQEAAINEKADSIQVMKDSNANEDLIEQEKLKLQKMEDDLRSLIQQGSSGLIEDYRSRKSGGLPVSTSGPVTGVGGMDEDNFLVDPSLGAALRAGAAVD